MANPYPANSPEWLIHGIFSGGTSLDWANDVHDATWEGE